MNLFSSTIPDCRLIWDATALSAAMRDPFTFVININNGYGFQGVKPAKFVFGQLWNEFVQLYYWLCETHKDGFESRLKEIVKSWVEEDKLNERCFSDTEKQTCSSTTLFKAIENFLAESSNKEFSLVVDKETNKPAIEVGFIHPLDIKTKHDEPYYLAGYLDLVVYNKTSKVIYPMELKTTRSSYGDYYIKQKLYSSVQFRTYELISKQMMEAVDEEYSGILCHICNVYVKKDIDFTRRIKQHNNWEVAWWRNQLQRNIKRYEQLAIEGRLSLEVALGYDPEVDPEGLVRFRSDNNPEPLADLFDKNPLERAQIVLHEMHKAGVWDPSQQRESIRIETAYKEFN